jgi:hypothetical protein
MEASHTTPAVERTTPPAVMVRIANPVLRRLLASPLHRAVSGQLMLLRLRGRRTGRELELPVARQEHQGRLAVYSNSTWRLNFRGGHDAEVVLEGAPQRMRGTLVEDVDEVTGAYAEQIRRLGWKAAQRRLGVRITVEREPTREELAAAVRDSGLSIVVFDRPADGASAG